MKIIGYCKGFERTNNNEQIPGVKVYYTEELPQLEDRPGYGFYGAVAFFPDKRNDCKKQIEFSKLEDYIENETEVDIYFNNFGRNPVIIPR